MPCGFFNHRALPIVCISVSEIAHGRKALFLHFDFPMDEDAHSRVEENDRAEHKKLAPLTHDHRAQHLTAKLEAQRERDTLRHGKTRVRLLFTKPDNTLHAGTEQDNGSGPFQQDNPDPYKIVQHDFRPMK